MSEIESLLREYERFVKLPWDSKLAGPQKVWLAVYDPGQERRLRPRLAAFESATLSAGHGWLLLDLTDAFAQWMVGHEYREEYFKQPEDMELALADFAEALAQRVENLLASSEAHENTVVALAGLGSLFGLARVSSLIARVALHIKGRLLGFFPGKNEGPRYYLFGVGDGWNYLAVPISAGSGRVIS